MPTNVALRQAILEQPQLAIWLTYLWQRRAEANRLGLVFGAGVSRDAGCPMWSKLVGRLAKAMHLPPMRMKDHRKAGLSETFIAEVVFRSHSDSHKRKKIPTKFRRFVVDASWRKKIHECLYRDIARKNFSVIIRKHRYLQALAELVCRAGFAVTFNFDDIVDEAVTEYAAKHSLPNPEIITKPKVETRKDAAVIYHINGVLPREMLRKASERLVLTEDAFADVLLSPNSLDAQFVINQFSVRSFILIGVSLTDNSLKNLLRSSANRNPANHHFIIFHEEESKPRSAAARKDIFDVNLNVYNLISIFLTTTEIRAFLELLNINSGEEFETQMSVLISKKIDRKYYLVGSVAAGKSVTLEALRCFQTFEEWSGRAPPAMYLDDRKLTAKDQRIVDDFVFPQLIIKNSRMMRQTCGIRIMDRTFLDLFAFSKSSSEILRKAKELDRRFKDLGKHFEDGHVFFIKASKDALEERLARRGQKPKRGFDAEALKVQEGLLAKVYRPDDAAILDTTDSTVGETAKLIARKVLLGEYHEFEFQDRLNEIIRRAGQL